MSNHHCHEGECCSGHHHHHHHNGSCCHDGCSCQTHHHECSDSCHKGEFAEQLLELADQAWMELLKEKIKKQIESENGSQLDGLAKLVSQANQARWCHKMESKKGCSDYKEKLADFFKKK